MPISVGFVFLFLRLCTCKSSITLFILYDRSLCIVAYCHRMVHTKTIVLHWICLYYKDITISTIGSITNMHYFIAVFIHCLLRFLLFNGTESKQRFCYIIVLCSNLMRLILHRHVPLNNLHTRELYCTILMSCFVKDMEDFLNSLGTLGSDANFSAVAHWRFC